ncbi:MAG: ABC transporter ATP-binding protein [Saccharofermentanales bacterium]|nr:ABC transporter ATP-binding protein [Clostridiaceae bacterium]
MSQSQNWEKVKSTRRQQGIGGHGPGGRPRLEKPKNAGKTLWRLFTYLSTFRPVVILAILLTIVASLCNIAGTYMLKPLINGFGAGLTPMDQIGQIIQMAIVYVVAVVADWLNSLLMVQTAQRTIFRIRNDLFAHLQDLPISYFDSKTHGELMSRFTNDVDNVNVALEQSLSQVISSIVTIVTVFIVMLILSPILTVAVVGMLAVILLSLNFIGKRSAKYFRRQQQALGYLNGHIEEAMLGQKVIKVFNHEEQTKADFAVLNEELRSSATLAQTFAGVMMPLMSNLSYVLYAIVAMGGALLTINGVLDVGTIAAYLTYIRAFTMPISNIANQLNMLLAALAGAERIFEVMDQPVEVDTGTVTMVRTSRDDDGRVFEDPKGPRWSWKIPREDGFDFRLVRGDVRFDSVTFGYTPEKGVLKSVTLYAKPGQKIAFVGSTGAGKTTITNLINRFYEIQDGSITYDGIPINEIRKSDLRQAMGMVLQDVHLFQDTIRENIRYGRLDATDEEVIEAAKLANAHSFIMKLPDGYDTVLTGDGDNLSQGQRQLLSIARAAVADPPVLILDEATSSVDTRTEKQIEHGMDQLMLGRTTLAIAHRLSTVRNANAIMVLENGEIIERGDHDDLLLQNGRYYELYTGISELT